MSRQDEYRSREPRYAISFRVPESIYLPFLQAVRDRSITQTEAMVEAMRDWVEKHNQENGKK